MASDVKINMAGVREVLRSKGVQSLLKREAQAACSRCNSLAHDAGSEPYAWSVDAHSHTATGHVFTATAAGKRDNAKYNTLLKGSGW
jgi:hypothetical protein